MRLGRPLGYSPLVRLLALGIAVLAVISRGARGNRRDHAFALASPVAMTERGDAHLPAEIQQFLEQPRIAVLATVRRDNSPATTRLLV